MLFRSATEQQNVRAVRLDRREGTIDLQTVGGRSGVEVGSECDAERASRSERNSAGAGSRDDLERRRHAQPAREIRRPVVRDEKMLCDGECAALERGWLARSQSEHAETYLPLPTPRCVSRNGLVADT